MSPEMKVVVFRVGNEEYGIYAEQVVSVEQMRPITILPRMPEPVVGVVHLQGIAIPIVDLRKVLSDRKVRDDHKTGIIIVHVDDDHPIGLLVDEVSDTLAVSPDSIQHPHSNTSRNMSSLLAVAKVQNRLLLLIDINRLLQDLIVLKDVRRMIKEEHFRPLL